jgi:hypothetical protein
MAGWHKNCRAPLARLNTPPWRNPQPQKSLENFLDGKIIFDHEDPKREPRPLGLKNDLVAVQARPELVVAPSLRDPRIRTSDKFTLRYTDPFSSGEGD